MSLTVATIAAVECLEVRHVPGSLGYPNRRSSESIRSQRSAPAHPALDLVDRYELQPATPKPTQLSAGGQAGPSSARQAGA
jgi:hypothetical protein